MNTLETVDSRDSQEEDRLMSTPPAGVLMEPSNEKATSKRDAGKNVGHVDETENKAASEDSASLHPVDGGPANAPLRGADNVKQPESKKRKVVPQSSEAKASDTGVVTPPRLKGAGTVTVTCEQCNKEWSLGELAAYYKCADEKCGCEMKDRYRDDLASDMVKKDLVLGMDPLDEKQQKCFEEVQREFDCIQQTIREKKNVDRLVIQRLWSVKKKCVNAGLMLPDARTPFIESNIGLWNEIHNCQVALALQDRKMWRCSFYSFMHFVSMAYGTSKGK